MRVLIIEDESLTAQRLEDMLLQYDPSIKVLDILPSVEEAVEWFQGNTSPDLVFMDIHLEDDLAFKIFEQTDVQVPVIFTTAFDEYMIKAFKVNSIDYLLKPVNYEELVKAIEKYKSLTKQFANANINTLLEFIGQRDSAYKKRFMIAIGSKLKSIETRDIAYFYAEDKLTFMVNREGQHLPVDFSLGKLETMLDPNDFYRISRQYLVSFTSIQTVYTHFKGRLKLDLKPAAKTEVFVSGDRMTGFKGWLGR
jgi:two-component system, LytTR family, response regulator